MGDLKDSLVDYESAKKQLQEQSSECVALREQLATVTTALGRLREEQVRSKHAMTAKSLLTLPGRLDRVC